MDRQWSCERIEDCFADNYTFGYLVRFPITEALLMSIEQWGSFSLEINRNFRRPCYFLNLEKGIRMKGIINDRGFKVSFPKADYRNVKETFERQLETLIQERGLINGESTE